MPFKRTLYLDQIKAVVVALVIALHVPMAFGGGWGWLGVHIPIEGTVGPFFKAFVPWYIYVINSFIMPMMFLISGYFVPRSVHKKGVVQYLRGRLLRLGTPLLAGMLVVNNGLVLISRLSPASPFAELPWNSLPFNTVMVLWFLVVLFVFDLLYCGWVTLREERFTVDTSVPTPGRRSWLITAFVLGVLEMVMTAQTELWAALWRTPLNGLAAQGNHIFTYAFLFFFGCKASYHCWFERLDTRLVVWWFRLSIFIVLGVLGLRLSLAFNANLADDFANNPLLGYFLYPFIAWGILSYLMMWFQRSEDRFGQWLATAGVNSYGAYIIHSLVLVVVLMAVGFIGIHPWLIAIVATVMSTIISFGIAGQLRRIPAVARVL